MCVKGYVSCSSCSTIVLNNLYIITGYLNLRFFTTSIVQRLIADET